MRNFGLARQEGSLGACAVQQRVEFTPPLIGNSVVRRALPVVLSVVAGTVDVIAFLALGGLFTAHITGNIVILAARFVAGEQAPLSHLLAVPIFMLMLVLTRLLAAWLERARIPSLTPLLLLELVLLSGFFAIGLAAGPYVDPNAGIMVLGGMLGVGAMAVQNALVRLSLAGAPSTAVMTTNVTVLAMDIGEILLAQDANRAAKARERARKTGTVIAGFVIGCAVGAASEHMFGLQSLAVPIGFASFALVLSLVASPWR